MSEIRAVAPGSKARLRVVNEALVMIDEVRLPRGRRRHAADRIRQARSPRAEAKKLISGHLRASIPPRMGSKRMTSAPSCARVIPPSGAATKAEASITRRPSRILYMSFSPPGKAVRIRKPPLFPGPCLRQASQGRRSPWLASRWHRPASFRLSSPRLNHPAWTRECALQTAPHSLRG